MDPALPQSATSSTPPPAPSTPAVKASPARSTSRNSRPNSGNGFNSKGSESKGEGEKKGSGKKPTGRGNSNNSPALPPASSEGLANLKTLIDELKDNASTPNTANSSTSQSPTRDRRQRSAQGASPSVPAINLPLSNNLAPISILNPSARGFTGGLSAITDMVNEGLITPTASTFDLMLGMPGQSPYMGNPAGNASRGANFAFPQSQPQTQAQLNLTQQQQLIAQQQQSQQFQLQQLQQSQNQFYQPQDSTLRFNTGMAPSDSTQESTIELMAEQLAIQQQFEQLRIQQENLLARFTDLKVAESTAASNRLQQQAQQAAQTSPNHRRINSQNQSPAMGSFGSGGMGNFQTPSGGSFGGISGPTSNLPRSHGRRQSVNTKSAASLIPVGVNTAPSTSMSNAPSLSGGFQFPNNGGNVSTPPPSMGYERYQRDEGNQRYGHARKESQLGSMSGGWSMPPSSAPATSAQLTEASHHLEELTSYRASSGHGRVPSFGMSGANGQSGMAGYGSAGQGQQLSGQQGRKNLFGPYLPQNSIGPLVRAGRLVIGTLRVNKKNRSDAYVSTEGSDADIYICGSKDRNRALEGDVVAVELLDVDEVWGTKKEKEEKKRKKEEYGTSRNPGGTKGIREMEKKKDDVEVEGQVLMLLEEEEVTDETKPQFAGHVVAVVERAPGQFFSGLLGVLRPSSAATQQKQDSERRERDGGDSRSNNSYHHHQAPKIIWFRPTDKRVPLMAIPTEQAPHDFLQNPDKYSNTLFVSCIKRWPTSSLHPFGSIVETLGPIGDIETETNALLKDCNFSNDEFNENVLKCLPVTPWIISDSEKESRRDYRNNTVFTIDPETARDLDDALHVVKLEDGNFEVGVHIADVTHFVKPGTALDREARKRATTVYLVQRAIPMLPRLLSETLCSLTPGMDKLTFSVVFTMSPDGKVLSTWFGKTIINSAVKLAYQDAQDVIEGRNIREEKIEKKLDRDLVENDIKLLADLAKQIRGRRFDGGALRIDNVKVSFGLDEAGVPNDCSSFIRKEANELIEEFMLMANIAVAGKIASGLPDQALLRCHQPPLERRLNAFIDRMNRLGLELDGSSAGTLMDSIQNVEDPASRLTLQHLSTKSMQRAKYFCTGMMDIAQYQHYALNVPLYTHFTSPIRRYADVMVHRQLEAILTGSIELRNSMDIETVAKIATNCNIKKDAARLAQEQSAHLFLCVLISDLTTRFGPVIRPATVIGVLDAAFDVMIPEFGIEKRVHVDQMPTEDHIYKEADNSLQIYWKKDVDVLAWLCEQNNDDHLKRVRLSANNTQTKVISTSLDSATESALFDDDDSITSSIKVSSQEIKSKDKTPLVFEEIKTSGKNFIQTIRELQTVPVVVTADITKSPPVIKVVSLNPFV